MQHLPNKAQVSIMCLKRINMRRKHDKYVWKSANSFHEYLKDMHNAFKLNSKYRIQHQTTSTKQFLLELFQSKIK